MPLFEYECRSCKTQFELLVRTGDVPACTACGGQDLEKLLSQIAVSSENTRAHNLKEGRKKYSKVHRDKQIAQAEYEEKHRHEH